VLESLRISAQYAAHPKWVNFRQVHGGDDDTSFLGRTGWIVDGDFAICYFDPATVIKEEETAAGMTEAV